MWWASATTASRSSRTTRYFSSVVIVTATEEISHIDVLLGLCLLLLLGLSWGSFSSATSGSGSTGWGSATSSDVGEELGDVLALEGLGEEAGPVALDGVTAGLDDLAELLLLKWRKNSFELKIWCYAREWRRGL